MTIFLALLMQAQTPSLPTSLHWALGAKFEYESDQHFLIRSDELDLRYLDQVSEALVSEAKESVGLQVERKALKAWMDGQELPITVQEPTGLGATITSRGALSSIDCKGVDCSNQFRMARLGQLVLPTQARPADSQWVYDYPASPDPNVPKLRCRYRVEWFDGSIPAKVAKIRIDLQEAGGQMTASGFAMLDLASGLPLSMNLHVERAPVPGGEGSLASLDWEIRNGLLRQVKKKIKV